MLKQMALASLFILSGCADFWNSYQVINPDGGGVAEDMTSVPDLAPQVCAPGSGSFSRNGDVFVSCCDDDTAKSSKNLQLTVEEAQRVSSSPTIVIGCALPRQLSPAKLQTELITNEESLLQAITKNVTIDGQGCSLDATNGGNQQRHFLVKSSGSLTLKNIKLMNGKATSIPPVVVGQTRNLSSLAPQNPISSGMACGGAILAFGPVTLDRVYLTNNIASHMKYAAGGALCLSNTNLKMVNSVIYDNSAVSANMSGSVKGAGAYLYSSNATVEHSSVIKNSNVMPAGSIFNGAAFYFDDENSPGAVGTFKFSSKNSLFVNFYAKNYTIQNNQTQNYAIRFSCQMLATEPSVDEALLNNVYDDVLYVKACSIGFVPTPTAKSSDIAIKYTGTDWAEPSGTQTQISPNGMWDDAFRLKASLDYCNKIPSDYFGIARIPSSGKLCMPGAVESRTR